jgi:hypothetical protein
MRGRQVEVITRTVQIHRQKENGIEAILLAISLRLHQHHLLGEAVGSICFFGVADPQIIFLERDRREFGICTDRTNGNEFTDAVLVSWCMSSTRPSSDYRRKSPRDVRGSRRYRPRWRRGE